MTKQIQIGLIVAVLALTGCGTKRNAVKESSPFEATSANKVTTMQERKLAFVQKVNDQKVYADNIVANMDITAVAGDKEITVPGTIRMRKDEVIRLQLMVPFIGSEIGRVEFTPDYVLIIDRMHKEYIKEDYNQLAFLKDNGLSFYSLQALFRNRLMLPGTSDVGEGDLKKFVVDLDEMAQNVPISYQEGNMKYRWEADRMFGRINEADLSYVGNSQNTSNLNWAYSDFKALGTKMFPTTQRISFVSPRNKLKKVSLIIDMDKVNSNDAWEPKTTVSAKYKRVSVKDIIGKLLKL